MMLIGKYSDQGIEIEGSADALRSLSQTITELGTQVTLSLSVPSIAPAAHPVYAKSLRLHSDGNAVCISRQEDEISIGGPPQKLAILAENINSLAQEDLASDFHAAPSLCQTP